MMTAAVRVEPAQEADLACFAALEQDDQARRYITPATLDEQLRRTRGDRNRPLLATGDPEEVLRRLSEVREPLYREIADLVIETDRSNPRIIAKRLISELP